MARKQTMAIYDNLPRQIDLMFPSLKALNDLGGSASTHQIVEKLSYNLELSEKLVNILHKEGSKRTEIDYRAAWARTFLKKLEAVDNPKPRSGIWTITDKGRWYLENSTNEELKKEYKDSEKSNNDLDGDQSIPANGISERNGDSGQIEATNTASDPDGYSVEDIVSDGCFVEKGRIHNMLQRLHTKKNLILQGPPGTGKTWLAKRLAWALVGRKDASRVRAVQFHPNLSYEDFIRGWRPSSNRTLDLVDGPFLEMVEAAHSDAKGAYVLVIEEINRGNPAQILGEMLTLLEADKRSSDNALELTYKPKDKQSQGVHLPPNLHVVGTMNIADRSLALVDFALRRRFAFVDLVPEIGERWQKWVKGKCGLDDAKLFDIQERMLSLNKTIESDPKLGRQFQVGHSYVTPLYSSETDPGAWYRDIVVSEIGPLLDEYWFDEPSKAQRERKKLLEGLSWVVNPDSLE